MVRMLSRGGRSCQVATRRVDGPAARARSARRERGWWTITPCRSDRLWLPPQPTPTPPTLTTTETETQLRHEVNLAFADLGGAAFALAYLGALNDKRLVPRVQRIHQLHAQLDAVTHSTPADPASDDTLDIATS